MSRIGKLPVVIPAGVKVQVANNKFTVTGPKGTLEQVLLPLVSVELKDNEVIVTRHNDEIESRSAHGLCRQLVHNMVVGVSEGYTKTLIVNGVGYRCEVDAKNTVLTLALGYSTIIDYIIPAGITIAIPAPGKIVVSGIKKDQVGQVCAEIRSLRQPEPYKGKGIKYDTENIRRKVGKSGGKK